MMPPIVDGYVIQWRDEPTYYAGSEYMIARWTWDKTKAQRWPTEAAAERERAAWAHPKYIRVVPLVRGEGSA